MQMGKIHVFTLIHTVAMLNSSKQATRAISMALQCLRLQWKIHETVHRRKRFNYNERLYTLDISVTYAEYLVREEVSTENTHDATI